MKSNDLVFPTIMCHVCISNMLCARYMYGMFISKLIPCSKACLHVSHHHFLEQRVTTYCICVPNMITRSHHK